MSEPLAPFRLKPWFSPRPWGRRSLEPWYSAAQVGTTEPVGEAWLTGPQCLVETELLAETGPLAKAGPLAGQSLTEQTLAAVAASHTTQLLGANHTTAHAAEFTAPAEFPLLIKLLFPAEKLSVQVHPDDAHARDLGQPRGKTECWYVLEAEPGAQIALGFNPSLQPEQVSPDAVRAAIAAGTLEDLLQWVPVAAGDMFFVDAGTVHAIGPGMVLLETQQTSDITFRMYDYGRPRELHVDQALRVMKTSTAAGKVAPQKIPGAPPARSLGRKESGAPSKLRLGGKEAELDASPAFTRLIQQRYFTVDRYDLAAGDRVSIPATHPGCLVPLSGSATVGCSISRRDVGGPGAIHAEPANLILDLVPGHAIVLPVTGHDVQVRAASPTTLIHTWAP